MPEPIPIRWHASLFCRAKHKIYRHDKMMKADPSNPMGTDAFDDEQPLFCLVA
jgi:hypothetical protein